MFKVEIELNGRIFSDSYYAKDLQELEDTVRKAFPKGKIISIIGS